MRIHPSPQRFLLPFIGRQEGELKPAGVSSTLTPVMLLFRIALRIDKPLVMIVLATWRGRELGYRTLYIYIYINMNFGGGPIETGKSIVSFFGREIVVNGAKYFQG